MFRRNTEAVYKFSQVFQQDADQGSVYAGTTASLVRASACSCSHIIRMGSANLASSEPPCDTATDTTHACILHQNSLAVGVNSTISQAAGYVAGRP